jgi:hypothetical protein
MNAAAAFIKETPDWRPRSLVTTQIQQTASQLIQRGIEPRLIPSIQSGAIQLVEKIRQLPITLNDALRNLLGRITAIRLAVQQALLYRQVEQDWQF